MGYRAVVPKPLNVSLHSEPIADCQLDRALTTDPKTAQELTIDIVPPKSTSCPMYADRAGNRVRQHQLRCASSANQEGWIFAKSGNRKAFLAWPNSRELVCPCAANVGLGRIGWHTFRHSHSSLLHALGVDLKVQQELLRHADIRTTNIYTHAVPAALRKANSKVVRLVLPAQVA